MSGDDISATDVYTAINGLRGEVREDQKAIWEEMKDLRTRDDEVAKCASANKFEIERHNGRLHNQETKVKNIKLSADKIETHVDNKAIHFDKELAKTTKLGYIAKKKFLAALLGLLTIIITIVTTYLFNGGT